VQVDKESNRQRKIIRGVSRGTGTQWKKIMSNWHPSNPSNQSWGCWFTLANLKVKIFPLLVCLSLQFQDTTSLILISIEVQTTQIVCCSWNQPSYYGFICPVSELGAPEDICAATCHHCRSLTLVLLKLNFIGAKDRQTEALSLVVFCVMDPFLSVLLLVPVLLYQATCHCVMDLPLVASSKKQQFI
jgi:hypothetical protein